MLSLTGPGRIHSRFKLSLGNILISLTWVPHTYSLARDLPWETPYTLIPGNFNSPGTAFGNALNSVFGTSAYDLCLGWNMVTSFLQTSVMGLALVTHKNSSLETSLSTYLSLGLSASDLLLWETS